MMAVLEGGTGMAKLRHRRFVIRGFVVSIFLAAGLSLPALPATAAGPSDTVRQFYGALLETMQQAKQLGPRGRFQKLEPAVQHAFDLPFMARLSIGSAWTGLNPEQKRRASQAYGRYATAIYASRFDGYAGEKFEIIGEQKVRRGTIVNSRIVKSDGEPVAINNLVHDNMVGYQIRDVYLSGTISELATRRSEFASILQSGGIDGLIAALNKKADDLQG